METIGIKGCIELYKIPDEWSDEDFTYWWCPETNKDGKILRPARISDEAKAQRLVKQAENIVTNAGVALFLTNASVSGQGSMNPFFQILSVGNGAITGVTRSDPSVAGDGFATGARKAPASYAVTGFTTQIVTNFASTDAVGTWTNLGIYGFNAGSSQSATTTTGTGSLMTHALFAFTKPSTAYALNYVITLSN